MVINNIRVSIGSAAVLGLDDSKLAVAPTNCYVMTYKVGHCSANCGFCPQARSSDSSVEKLSRVTWPIYPFKEFLTKLKYITPLKRFQRICIQTLNYPENFEDLKEILENIKKVSNIPISVAIPPMEMDKLLILKQKGVERIGIALDGATEEVFNYIKGNGVKGPYTWDKHFEALTQALEIFGKGYVSTHIIVGLGETEKDIIEVIEKIKDMNVLVSLFAFTPIKGTQLQDLKKPELIQFRKIQLARYLIIIDNKTLKDFTFNLGGSLIKFNINKNELKNIIEESDAFLTTGCPGCNRPFYTSSPSGPIYNYPRLLKAEEKNQIYELLEKFVI